MYRLVTSQDTSTKVAGLMRNMAEYFVKFSPLDDSNLYVSFVKELKSKIDEIVFSTLNYDLLFENALSKNQLSPTYFSEVQGKVYFLKVHGSSNFIPPPNIEVEDIGFVGYGTFFNYELCCGSVEDTLRFCNSNTALSPSMCLYTNLKRAQFGHEGIEKIQEIWREYVYTANKILIIGAKYNNMDTHIWESLSKTQANIGYIGSKESYSTWNNSYRSRSNTEYLGDYWNDSFSKSVNFLTN